MDYERARELLEVEKARVKPALKRATELSEEFKKEVHESWDDWVDRGEAITQEEIDRAIASTLQQHLEAIERAFKRLENGTYGYSVLSGKPISDERLEVSPAAELTAEEAADRARNRP
jgi:RNA polymerase-binding transcription factor